MVRALLSLFIATAALSADRKVEFNRDVRPILAAKCYACHGPDEDKREADLRLDLREDAVRSAIVPGKPAESEVWKRIVSADPDDVMPPPSSPKQLTATERTLLHRWIAEGAEYQPHWSFTPIQRPAADGASIDHFIDHELRKHGLQRSPVADPRTLIRRLHLDLTGLPPSPDDVSRFESECATRGQAAAWAALVDRQLASPHFGERWARHWLDMARYADSNGFLGDAVRPNAWRYRDWVIHAINRDLPFDQFTVQQLAGDLLPAGQQQPDILPATGFHRNAALNTEAGVDKEEARYQNLVDRVNTTGRVWLGLTLGCAQCHTHKYDPITIRDYYSFYAFFNNTVDKDDPKTKAPQLAELAQGRRQTYVHMAGDYTRRGPDVTPVSLSALPPMANTSPQATRTDLARWIVSAENPLTRRVAVNQVWSKLFGTGIVSTVDDFGATGEPPSHPELLDYLASEFQRLGWSRKALISLIVTSQTYQQQATLSPQAMEIDPLNRLLSRQNRLRLDAEILRDSALTVSGLLTRSVGGTSIKPPLPGDIFDVGRSVKWEVSQGGERYRRGLYILTMRSVLYPMLTTFDSPDATDACVKRERSNTPLQALTLMNDPVFMEAAQALALRVMRESPPSTTARIQHLYQLCLARPARPEEEQRLLSFHQEQRQRVQAEGPTALAALGLAHQKNLDPIETVTLVALARLLLNVDEFITR